ncbi:MAG: Hsp70 family protein [Erysipelotrichaceae bacterium]|nr:Hsp70 family protein [Erysipelotrichaceae bacterium]MDD4642110.1 Hsp70 family protein [Erysipelotrichaceae bacterium]
MILGVDLGTTNSTVGYFNEDHWELIPNEYNEFLTPSVVCIENNGEYIVGKIAKEKIITSPKNTFYNFKRTMGTDRRYSCNGKDYSSEELSAILLRYLICQAERYLNQKVDEIIVTVPAYFDDKQRIATKNAGRLTNVKIERLINEPSAAALAYHHKNGNDGYYMIFDFGGGTLDISIVDVFMNVIDVQSITGDNNLGGVDIDNMIVDHFIKQFPNLRSINKDELSRLRSIAEQTKIKLSDLNEYELVFVYKNDIYRFKYDIQTLANICKDVLLRIKELLTRVLKDAQIDTIDLTAIIGIGGSSKMLMIKQYLEMITHKPFIIDIDPQNAVAIGATIATAIKTRNNTVKNIILTDVCPFSLGVGIINDEYSVIIAKNSSLPCSQTSLYTTIQDDQSKIKFVIYQGDDYQASMNKELARIIINVPPLPKGEANVSLKFSYDINGILNVEAVSEIAQRNKTIITNNMLDEETIDKKRKELDQLINNTFYYPEANYLLERAKVMYQDVPINVREHLGHAIIQFERVLNNGKATTILRNCKSFSKYLDYIALSDFHVTIYDDYDDNYEDSSDDEDDKLLS